MSSNGLKRDGEFDMPQSQKPTKIRRALAACKNCRKQKTRCDHKGGAPCHRCKVLGLECEFDNENLHQSSGSMGGGQVGMGVGGMMASSPSSTTGDVPTLQRMDRFELRMERMENSIQNLISALEHNMTRSAPPPNQTSSPFPPPIVTQGAQEDNETDVESDNITRPTAATEESEEHSPAPVEIMRDLASEFLDHESPKTRNKYTVVGAGDDIINKGILTEQQAQHLLDIFIEEYGKWIGFPPLPTLLNHLRQHSPLLLTATCLIASRHLPFSSDLDTLVSNLFAESRRLLSLVLLNVPRNVETLQAILILSVWSPLAKRLSPRERPLSGGRTLDSWLVSGYGIMLGMTVIRFNDLTRSSPSQFKGPQTPVGGGTHENAEGISQRLRVWNHLCLIHLHYSVGTRRPCILETSLIGRCRAILNVSGVEASNHDQRMVAEILLYAKLYKLLGGLKENAGIDEQGELQQWRDEWDYLFRREGHQYIEIGYYFAHLMLHAQALKFLEGGSEKSHNGGSTSSIAGSPAKSPTTDIGVLEKKKQHMSAISQLSTQILQRARLVGVAEIRHVTDIIYFIIAFAGVSLCRLLPSIQIFGSVKADEFRNTLNTTITEGVEWLRSVAISQDHIAFKFAEIIAGLHSQIIRRQQRRETSLTTTPTDTAPQWLPQPVQQGFAIPTPSSYFMSEGTSPFGVYGQGFGQATSGLDESYFVGLFPELMGPGFVDGGYAGGVGQGGGGNGFEDALGLWGFTNR